MDTLANALNCLKVGEVKGKKKAILSPASKVIREVLLLFQKNGFIGEFKFVDDGKSGEFAVELVGKINDTKVIKPRFSVSGKTWEKFETRFLPAKGIGFLVVSTSKGIMTHTHAQEKNLGGRLLCYVY